MSKCKYCGHEMELAEYLDNDEGEGFASAEICMNEDCPGADSNKS